MIILNIFLSFYCLCTILFKYMNNSVLPYLFCLIYIFIVKQSKREEVNRHSNKIVVALLFELFVVKILLIPWI